MSSEPVGNTAAVLAELMASEQMSRLAPVSTDPTKAAPTAKDVVADFCAERERYITSINNCHPDNTQDYYRWQGHAEARRQLAERLDRSVATTGDTPRGVLRSGDFDGIARKVIADYPRDVYGQVAVVSMLREAAAQGAQLASAGGEDNGNRAAEKMPAPKFNVGDDVLYGSWTTPRTIHRRYWDDEADSWVYCAAREGMASVEASEDRLTLAAVAGVSSHPGAQPGEAQA